MCRVNFFLNPHPRLVRRDYFMKYVYYANYAPFRKFGAGIFFLIFFIFLSTSIRFFFLLLLNPFVGSKRMGNGLRMNFKLCAKLELKKRIDYRIIEAC